MLVHRRNLLAENFDRARCRFHRADDVAKHGAFSAAAPAHDDQCFAAMNLERDVIDDCAIAELSNKIDNFNYEAFGWHWHGAVRILAFGPVTVPACNRRKKPKQTDV